MEEEPAGRPSAEDHTGVSPALATFRRLLSESLGTFLLTGASIAPAVFAAGLGIAISDPVKAVAPGIIVALVIYSIGDVSGAHINPAVTIAFALRRAFPWARVPGYLAAQLVGGCLAATMFRVSLGTAAHLGTSVPIAGTGTSLIVEIMLSALLMLVILNVSTRESLVGAGAAIPVGLAVAVDGLLGGKVSGASMNPARSLGPALVSGSVQHVWVYVVGPVAGAILAAVMTYGLHGRYTAAEKQSAQGEE